MADLLVVLNPRKIEDCVQSLRELDLDVLWLQNMTEANIADNWDVLLERYGDYDRWILAGDDMIARQHALDAVLSLHDEGYPVVTGWSNIAHSDLRANLTKTPLVGDVPTVGAYDLYHCEEVFGHPSPAVKTWLTGFTLCCASVDMWRAYPFSVYGGHPGYGSDFSFSKRLELDGIPIIAAREGFCWHVKENWNQVDRDERKRSYVGIELPRDLIERK